MVRVASAMELFKIILKASPAKFFFIFLVFILPLSLFQALFEIDSPLYTFARFIRDLVCNESSSDEYKKKLVRNAIPDCVYLVLFSTFYMLSTIVMTFAISSSLDVSKPLSYISIRSAIPRISKNLAITFLHAFPFIFLSYAAYFMFLTVRYAMNGLTVQKTNYVLVVSFIAIVLIAFCEGFLLAIHWYMIALWNTANVISILEPNTYGSAAMERSNQILQEDKSIYDFIFSLYLGSYFLFLTVNLVVELVYDMNIIVRVSIISLCVFVMAVRNFLGLIAQNLIYYECTCCDNQVIVDRVSDEGVLELGKDNHVEDDKLEV